MQRDADFDDGDHGVGVVDGPVDRDGDVQRVVFPHWKKRLGAVV